jgi:hypothetical protein
MNEKQITGCLCQNLPGRMSTWLAGTRVKIFMHGASSDLFQPTTVVSIERTTNTAGSILQDTMANVPMSFITLDDHIRFPPFPSVA